MVKRAIKKKARSKAKARRKPVASTASILAEAPINADHKKALEKALEWGEKIPIGIFYKKERPIYSDSLSHVKNEKLTKLPKQSIDITATMKEFM